jgi:hypothetical protein
MAAVLLLGAVAVAEEVTVQNDTYTGPPAGLEGAFAPGEQVGVLLTAPCDGAIVAVQIGWTSLTGTTGPSLERNIWIYSNAETFPTPGAALLQLEGPVLNDGAINEFRYVDEGETIEINVPVTKGQKFYVALEFENATNPQTGTPAVFHDLNTCTSGKNVLYANILGWAWFDFCSLGWSGNTVIRAVIDCQEETGACCEMDASCNDDVEQGDCQEAGQTFFVGQTCAQVTCPPPTGACCIGAGCLPHTEQALCEIAGGTYAGDWTECDDNVCQTGACCSFLGECVELLEVQCTDPDSTFMGPGTTCSPNPCTQPGGACCYGASVCFDDQTEEDCTNASGEWAGAFTVCTGACECFGVSYTPGDINGDTFVDGSDIQDFVDEYITPTSPSASFCAADMCRSGAPLDEVDLLAFVACILDPGTCGEVHCLN